MTNTARFLRAVDDTRPYQSHRYDVFGPKINRRLSLYRLKLVDAWLLLESDPAVVAYCERPLLIPGAKPKRFVDFWVGYKGHEEIWLLSSGDEQADFEPAPALSDWAKSNRCAIRAIKPPDESARTYLDNWGVIVRELSSNRRYLTPALMNAVRATLAHARPIMALCQLLPDHDPVLVRTALFSLIHSGDAVCTDMTSRTLGPHSLVVRA